MFDDGVDDSTARRSNPASGQCADHGTHVASLVGGLTFGAGKGVNLKSVIVLDCDGNTDALKLINATEWLADRFDGDKRTASLVVMAVGEIGHIHDLNRSIEKYDPGYF